MPTGESRTIKEQALEMIQHLPEKCTTDDMHYQLYLLDKIRRGEEALKRGGIAHGEVRRRAAAWRRK